MTKKFIFLMLFCLIADLAFSSTVAYWELDEADGTVDAVGSYTLTAVGTEYFSVTREDPIQNPDVSVPWNGIGDDSSANPSSAFFTGTNCYYYANPLGAHDGTFDFNPANSFTVEGWLWADPATAHVVGNIQANGTGYPDGAGWKGWRVAYSSNGTVLRFYIDGAAATGYYKEITASINAGELFHFAAVWDAAAFEMRLYVNGELRASGAGDAAWSLSRGGELSIGGRDAGTGYNSWMAKGRIDEIRYSDTVLTPQGFLKYSPPTVAYWELDGAAWDGNDAVSVYNLDNIGTPIDSGLRVDNVPNPEDFLGWHGFNSAPFNPLSTWFDGTLAYYHNNPAISHDDTFDFDPAQSFTVEGWFSIPSVTSWIVGNRTGNASHAVNGLWKGWSVQVQNAGTELVFYIDGASASGYQKQIVAAVVPGDLTHFAAIWDADTFTMNLYVDGVLAAAGPGDANWSFNRGGQLSIGARDAGTGYNSLMASGRIDEIRISRVVLTSDEFLNKYPPCGAWGYLISDINKDCRVDFIDFAKLAGNWLDCDPNVANCN